MSNIILRGGMILFNREMKLYQPINIMLNKSPVWNYGLLYLNHNNPLTTPLYKFIPDQDYFIEFTTLKNRHTLYVDDAIIYESEHKFSYDINIKLNSEVKPTTHIPYGDFFKYY